MIRENIEGLIEKSIKELQKEKIFPEFDLPRIKVELPEEELHGDYATNIAMVVTKQTKKSPIEIAENLGSRLQTLGSGFFEKVEVAKPGFINFFISREYLQRQVGEILKQKEKFGQLKIGRGKRVQVEFISANPTGPLTVGNARGGPFGDVLANVLKKAGFRVERAYYINDYGMQILILGHSVLKDNEAQYKGSYIDYLNKKIKEREPSKAGEAAARIIIEEMIKKTTDRLGIKYDEWFSELSLHKTKEVDKALEFLKKKDLIYEKDGAWWFLSSKYGDKRDRVVIKSDREKTYLAGDIAYHRYKFEKKKFDKVIDVWGADHAGDVVGLQAAVEALGHKGKLDIILLQFVTLFERKERLKMSKRRGMYISMDELLNEVPLDVIRFFFLQKSADTHLNFDISLAKEQSEKNPVYYVQYAHARIFSILKKVKKLELKINNLGPLKHPSELALIKQLIRFPEIVTETSKDYQVQRLPQYAVELATIFHQFYRDCRVITEDKDLTQARLALISTTKIILRNTLDLMGISAPEKM